MKPELILPLKKKWFDLIKSGIKKEEYREIKDYYMMRFCNNFKKGYCKCPCPLANLRKFNKVTFTLGYPKSDDIERRITFNNPTIRIGYGREAWGAQKDELYFIISWFANK